MYNFFVEGKPQGKARPRVTRYGTYTPQKTKDYERLVCQSFGTQCRGFTPYAAKTPIYVSIFALFPIPKSYTKRDKQKAMQGLILPTTKPDCDNIAKAILDSLNGIVYKDDNQVVILSVKKEYAVIDENVGVFVSIWTDEDYEYENFTNKITRKKKTKE